MHPIFVLTAFTATPIAALAASPAAAPTPLVVATLDEGDDAAAVIANLAERELHELVVREARTYLDTYPSHRRANGVRYRLAGALFELKQIDDARREYEALDRASGFEQAVEVKYRLGECAMAKDDPKAAVDFFAAAAQGAERSREANYLREPATFYLGEALFGAERFAEASRAYANALAVGGPDGEYARAARYGVVWSAFEAGAHEAVVRGAAEFLNRHADDDSAGEVAFLAGEALLAAGQPADALPWYDRVRQGDYLESAMRGAAFAEAERGEHIKAAERFNRTLERFPNGEFAAECALQRGVQLVRAEKHTEAVRALTARGVPETAEASYWRAVAFAGADQDEEALRAAMQGLERGADGALATRLRVAAADALFELDRPGEAAALYEASGSPYALHAGAVALLNAGDAAGAARLAGTLLKGAAKNPGSEYRCEALLVQGEALFRQGEHEAAERPLRTLLAEVRRPEVAANPPIPAVELARAMSRLAWCRWYAGDDNAAKEIFDLVAGNDDARPAEREEALFMAGRAALRSGDDAGARQRFARYVDGAEAGAFTAEALLRLGRLEEGEAGLARFDAVASRFPDHELAAAALFEAAERRVALGDAEGAARGYAALLERFPEDPMAFNAHYGLGWARHTQGQHAEATEPLWRVARAEAAGEELRTASLELLVWVEGRAEHPGRCVEAFLAFAERVGAGDSDRLTRAARAADGSLAAAGDAERRAEVWQAVDEVTSGPAKAAARVELGFVALDRGDRESATRMAAAARDLAPKDESVAELCFFVGEAHFDAGEDAMAVAHYELAAEFARDEVAERALYKGGFAHLRAGQADAAGPRFIALVQRFPDGVLAPEAMYLAGEAHYRQGEFEDAARWLREMTTKHESHDARPKALFRLGIASGELELWEAAEGALSELLSKHPEFPSRVEAELWRGRALRGLDRRRAARQSLSRVVENDEGVLAARARIELGRLSESENDAEGAVAEYLKVAVLYAHDEECAEALVRAGDVLARTGKEDRAKDCWSEAARDYPKTAWAEQATTRLK